jgi:methylenetetrahydrofolate dehydrogenase (NADP+)/methenyltetrahydrofolate cyclohydrolase
MMLMGENATVTVCHTKTADTAAVCQRADIIVSAAGVLGSLTADFVRPGQTVIDVSINWDESKGSIAGDAKFDEVAAIVDAITPVPGGVGAVTTSVLMKHVILSAEKN